MPKLTIHTATYNRGYILGEAYESLKKQTNTNFEWIITDDGSTDDTENLVRTWLEAEPGFKIRYNKLNHVGLPRALNSGVNIANGEWFMRLDSDDTILPDTVDLVIRWVEEIQDNPEYCGVAFARCYPDGKYMKDQEPIVDKTLGYVDATHLERKKYNLDMDMCEVHRTSIMKAYPSKCWPGEYFAPEQLNLYEIAMAGYKLRWRPDKLYICSYRSDGLTKDDRIVKNNPMGFAMMYNQNILLSESRKEKVKNTIRMTALAIYGRHPEFMLTCNDKILAILTFPFGAALAIRRARQYKRMG